MQVLTETQRQKIAGYIPDFLKFMKTDIGKSWHVDRVERKKLMQDHLSKNRIHLLTEEILKKIIKELWATQFWTDKEYKANSVIKQNATPEKTGAEVIRDALSELLYGSDSFPQRYDQFRERIKGLGTSSVSEILCFADPTKYCIWNQKPQTILPYLGIKSLLPERVFKYPNDITGEEYWRCCEVIGLIRDVLRANGIDSPDFTDADCFLWYLFDQVYQRIEPPPPPPPPPPDKRETKIESHADAEAMLLKLGRLLGYETYVADPAIQLDDQQKLGDLASIGQLPSFTYAEIVESAKYIDVIWFRGEFPRCCFEVEHTTDVTKGLLRLYQIRHLENVKFFIVAPSEQARKFQAEAAKDPFKQIKSRYIFKTYEELCQFYESTRKFVEAKCSFFGEDIGGIDKCG